MNEWNEAEKIEILLHSLKAERLCPQVRKIYNLCRSAMPGKIIDPGSCLMHAKTLIDCFHEAKEVYSLCANEFNKAKDCLNDANNSIINFATCDQEIDEYLECYHPLGKKYENYGHKLHNR